MSNIISLINQNINLNFRHWWRSKKISSVTHNSILKRFVILNLGPVTTKDEYPRWLFRKILQSVCEMFCKIILLASWEKSGWTGWLV